MLNNGLRQDSIVNVVAIGTHLWYKLNESYETVSYMCLRGILARDDMIKGSQPLDFKCLHAESPDSAFHDLTMLVDDGKLPFKLRLLTEKEIAILPADDASVVFGCCPIVSEITSECSEHSLVFVVADIPRSAHDSFVNTGLYDHFLEGLAALFNDGATEFAFISKAKYWLVKATIRAVFKRPKGLGDNEVAKALVKHVHSTNVNDSWNKFQLGFFNTHPPVLPENYQFSIDHFSDDLYEISEIFVIEKAVDSCIKDLIVSRITKELDAWKSFGSFQQFRIDDVQLVSGGTISDSAEPQPICI